MNTSGESQDVVLLVDIANVMGSIPDGWWRDRKAAATRLLKMLEHVNGADVTLPGRVGDGADYRSPSRRGGCGQERRRAGGRGSTARR